MIIIGSRGSALALAQTEWVRQRILDRFPKIEVSVKIIKTSADNNQTASLRSSFPIGAFVKELEQALIDEEIDVAVHSMKDVPTECSPELKIAVIPEREDPHDAFISTLSATLSELPHGARVGTGSMRRQAQLLAVRPDLQVTDIRGNIDTRIKKLSDGGYDAIVLACAGLNRLGLQHKISSKMDFIEMLPAPGQGALAIQIRADDSPTESVISHLHHKPTAAAVIAERIFLRKMGGGCNVPVAVHAFQDGDLFVLDGLIASPDGKKIIRDSERQKMEELDATADSLADRILAKGGQPILDSLK